jgi:hypothetical protein
VALNNSSVIEKSLTIGIILLVTFSEFVKSNLFTEYVDVITPVFSAPDALGVFLFGIEVFAMV